MCHYVESKPVKNKTVVGKKGSARAHCGVVWCACVSLLPFLYFSSLLSCLLSPPLITLSSFLCLLECGTILIPNLSRTQALLEGKEVYVSTAVFLFFSLFRSPPSRCLCFLCSPISSTRQLRTSSLINYGTGRADCAGRIRKMSSGHVFGQWALNHVRSRGT